jgi:2-keto-3-deoxy-L-rhamnonate aldolase RhmA
MINTAEEAAAVVTYSKFPPLGLRGQGSAFPAIGHGLTTPEYMKTANETLLTILQIESKQGVENVDAIAAVPGVGESSHLALDLDTWADCQTTSSSAQMTWHNPSWATLPHAGTNQSSSTPSTRSSPQRRNTVNGSDG